MRGVAHFHVDQYVDAKETQAWQLWRVKHLVLQNLQCLNHPQVKCLLQ